MVSATLDLGWGPWPLSHLTGPRRSEDTLAYLRIEGEVRPGGAPKHTGPKTLSPDCGRHTAGVETRPAPGVPEGSPHPHGEGAPSLVFSAEDPELGNGGSECVGNELDDGLEGAVTQ